MPDGCRAATADSVSDLMRRFVDIFPYLAPGLLGMGVILLAALHVAWHIYVPAVARRRWRWLSRYRGSGCTGRWLTRPSRDWPCFFSRGVTVLAAAVFCMLASTFCLVSQTLFFCRGWRCLGGSGAAAHASGVTGGAVRSGMVGPGAGPADGSGRAVWTHGSTIANVLPSRAQVRAGGVRSRRSDAWR